MSKVVMERKAADNKYLHRDFHKSLDLGLAYIGERYGDNGVKTYLRDFAREYYAPLVDNIQKTGLSALAAHIEATYEIEEMPEVLEMTRTEETLHVRVAKCPAIAFFQKTGYTPSPWYIEATRTVNETIADMAGLCYTQHSYDETDGHCEYTFRRRG
ncbi:hypothetical protein LJC27_06290 [Christensenellaceae bacterium OttesenSCG-928-M15]|nr:hypothetical protein [Christensenellaceae bacterium OttesenSCG-928-M15]